MTGELTTNLNQAPYFNSFDANSGLYNVLFKPSYAVQTREMNELQSMLLNQVAKFGDNIFTSGTIISGCNLNFDSALQYAKLQDNYANGAALTPTDLIGFTAVSNSGLTAYIKNAQQGFISNAPNLNTLYIKYLNSATNTAIKTFQNDELLTIYNQANVLIGTVVMANSTSSGSSNSTGVGYAVSIDSGVCYQKGLFLDVDAQTLIVNPYDNQPDNISVGFSSIESIVTAFQNPSLNDNAQGAPNYAAPGADRLRITPELVSVNSQSIVGNSFFSLVDFVGGSPSIINANTSYSIIGDKIAEVSSDTNGSFIIKPFNVSVLQANTSNAVFNEQFLRLKVSAGQAYVNGQNINIIGEVLSVIPKGTDIGYANSQIISTRYGNYVTIQDVAGQFDPTQVQTIYLQSANAYGVSNNISKGVAVNSISPPGTTIGNASLSMFEYVSGQRDEKGAQYNAHLFHLNMAPGYSFSQVASLYSNSGGINGVADIIQLGSGTNTVLYGANSAPLVYAVNVAAMDTLKTSSNTIDTQFEFRTATSASFPTGGTITITVPSYTGGTNELPYGTGPIAGTSSVYDFLVVATSNTNTANIGGSVTTTATSNVITGSGTNFASSLYPGALITVANATFAQTAEVSVITNTTYLTTTNPIANSMATSNLYISFLAGENIPLEGMGANLNIINSTAFSVNLATTLATTMTANVFFNVLRIGASPRKKDLQTQVWALINCANHTANTVGPWCLGVPDIYQIENVYVGTTWANTNPVQATTTYGLNNGQGDAAYNLGYLISNGLSLSSSSRIMVEFSCFLPDVSQGIGFYSVDSYPIDDTGATPNTIFTQDIPTYFSPTSQQIYDLRNAIDFRIYVANTIPLINTYAAAVVNTAIINPATTITNITTNNLMPVPSAIFETSYQYYLGRYDVFGLSSPHGIIVVNNGIPSSNPIPPGNIPNGMTLGTIYVPPYPSITPDIVDPNMRKGYPTAYINYQGNRRYTMADIGNLDKQIQQLQYYTSLSLLEQSTQNLLLTNSNGATRFNNGILADPMQDFSIANTLDPAFNIAIDSANSWARPTFTQHLINLVPTNYVNTEQNASWITLDFNQVGPFINQPFASQLRNCSQDILYIWNGTLTLNPTGAFQPDVTTNPIVTVNINQYSNWVNLVNGWNSQWGTWNESSVAVTSNTSSISATTTTTTNKSTTSVTSQTDTYNFGDVVTSVALQPFVPPTFIKFVAYGLKPSTQFWFFVNDLPQTQNCMQTSGDYSTVFFVGSFTSDTNGNIAGFYYLPGNTFTSGQLNFQLLDISNLVTEQNLITSLASATFYGTNLAYTKNQLNLQTIEPQFSFNSVSSTVQSVTTANTQTINNIVNNNVYNTYNVNNSVNVTVNNIVNTASQGPVNTYCNSPPTTGGALAVDAWQRACIPGDAYLPDPIAQSFSILGASLPPGVQCCYATSLNLYFQTKDVNLGVTVYLVPLVTGLPSTEILPYSSVHLTSAQVNVSANGSVATNVAFPAPVVLEVAQDYAFVVVPDGSNPNYAIWTATIGGKDVLTNAPIYALSATGEMFLSSQGVTWTPYQNEAVKFQLYIANFPNQSGTVTFTNDTTEFLTIANNYGQFRLGDLVWFANPTNNTIGTIGGQAQTVLNSNTVICGSTTGLVNGTSAVMITSTTQKLSTAVRVANVINSTAFTTTKASPFTDNTTCTIYNVTGNPYGYVQSVNSTYIAVTNSAANASSYLSNTYSYIISDTYNQGIANSFGTGAFCQSTALIDHKYDTLMPKFSTSIPSLCYLNIVMRGVSNSALSYANDASSTFLTFGSSIDFLDHERVVMSRSNELQYKSGAKSLTILGSLATQSSLETPAFDIVKAGAIIVHNIVNAETYSSSGNTIYLSEVNNLGNSNCRYISTTVTLAQGVVAQDLNVYLGAFYPGNTEVYVYAKLINQYDPTTWTSQVWSPMITLNTTASSKLNVYDFNEYLYTFANTPAAPGCAFYNQSNGGILSYNNPQQGNNLFSGFQTFAVKVVLCADASQNVPLITDLRAIALS